MKLDRRMTASLALGALTSVLCAQEPAKSPAPTTNPAHAAIAAAVKAEPAQILLHVSGLTKDNQAAIKEALGGIGAQVYVCPTCKHEQAAQGKCTTCKVDLQAQKLRAFANVALMPEAGSITLTLAGTAPARLSEIESALARSSARVEENRLALTGTSTLVVTQGTADLAPTIEKALKDAKLFEEVHARFDAPRSEIDVRVHSGTSAPQRDAVAKAIEASGTKARLTDVVWGHPAGRT